MHRLQTPPSGGCLRYWDLPLEGAQSALAYQSTNAAQLVPARPLPQWFGSGRREGREHIGCDGYSRGCGRVWYAMPMWLCFPFCSTGFFHTF
jgi:hypothetical protein